MKTAFKEWAVIVDALGRGAQIIVLRKGGLSEGAGGFQVDHPEFLLFPTLYHQQRQAVLPEAQARFDALAPRLAAKDRVRIEFCASVVAGRRLDTLEVALRLAGQHVWREEVIAARFDWGRDKAIHALALRVCRLPAPVELPVLEGYGGCKSWLELAEDVPVAGAVPVLDAGAFAARLAAFHAALDGAVVSSA